MAFPLVSGMETFTRMRFLLKLIVCLIIGMLSALSLPPWHQVYLLFISFPMLLFFISIVKGGVRASIVGWVFGFGHFVVGFYWVGYAFLVDAPRYGWLAPFAVILLASILSFFPALTTFLTWRIIQRLNTPREGAIIIFALLWALMEWVRSFLFSGFPWNLIGTVWANSDEMMQFASVGGVYGLGFVTIIFFSLPILLVGKPITIRGNSLLFFGFLGFLIFWFGGVFRLLDAKDLVVKGVNFRLVQANIPQNLKWNPHLKFSHIERQIKLSSLPSKINKPPSYIIWPETAVTYDLANEKLLRLKISKLLPKDVTLITGAPRSSVSSEGKPLYWNSLHALASNGTIIATYDKAHLVPFGEYIPFQSIIGLSKLTEGRVDFSPGRQGQLWKLPNLPIVAPLICYEAIFPNEVAMLGLEPGWFLNITNDAWFGLSAGPYQHLAAVRFRAVEMGVPLIRVANTGISAVIDSYGRIRNKLALGTSGIIDFELPLRTRKVPLYGRFGNIIMLVVFVGASGLALCLRQSNR